MIPTPLPAGYEIWAIGITGKEWKTAAHAIQFKTPDGDIEIGISPEGRVVIRTYNMQSQLRAGGPDNVIVFESLTR